MTKIFRSSYTANFSPGFTMFSKFQNRSDMLPLLSTVNQQEEIKSLRRFAESSD